MVISTKQRINKFMNGFVRRNPEQSEFHQAVQEVAVDVIPFVREYPIYEEMKILERLTEPDQIVMYAPSKASNAGGEAVSGLEMTQNSMHMSWSGEDIEKRLHEIMKNIHHKCVQYGSEGDDINYRKGVNIAGFVKVADAMVACGNI